MRALNQEMMQIRKNMLINMDAHSKGMGYTQFDIMRSQAIKALGGK
jgi:hypothetical protein